MDARAVLARFDREMRAEPAAEPAIERRWVDGVLRAEGAFSRIDWWDFPAVRAGEIARREAAYFARRPLEWKLYSHDRPPGVAGALADAGFAAEEPETFLAIAVSDVGPAEAPDGVEIRIARGASGAADFAAVSAAAFGRPGAAELDAALGRLEDPGQLVFIAYAEGSPVAGGRLELPAGRAFAGLYGGGVAPAWRGRGLYRALVLARAAEARSRSYAWLTVDALETSRPVLERMGFQPLASVQGWSLSGEL